MFSFGMSFFLLEDTENPKRTLASIAHIEREREREREREIERLRMSER